MTDPVLAANRAFYTAFSAFDMDAMQAVWSQRDSDVCVHPGWPPLVGWPAIRQSWANIFGGAAFMRVAPVDEQVVVRGDMARVLCMESLYTVQDGVTRQGQVVTTHVFERVDGLWRMVLHHASPQANRR